MDTSANADFTVPPPAIPHANAINNTPIHPNYDTPLPSQPDPPKWLVLAGGPPPTLRSVSVNAYPAILYLPPVRGSVDVAPEELVPFARVYASNTSMYAKGVAAAVYRHYCASGPTWASMIVVFHMTREINWKIHLFPTTKRALALARQAIPRLKQHDRAESAQFVVSFLPDRAHIFDYIRPWGHDASAINDGTVTGRPVVSRARACILSVRKVLPGGTYKYTGEPRRYRAVAINTCVHARVVATELARLHPDVDLAIAYAHVSSPRIEWQFVIVTCHAGIDALEIASNYLAPEGNNKCASFAYNGDIKVIIFGSKYPCKPGHAASEFVYTPATSQTDGSPMHAPVVTSPTPANSSPTPANSSPTPANSSPAFIREPESRVREPESRVREPESRVREPETPVREPESPARTDAHKRSASDDAEIAPRKRDARVVSTSGSYWLTRMQNEYDDDSDSGRDDD